MHVGTVMTYSDVFLDYGRIAWFVLASTWLGITAFDERAGVFFSFATCTVIFWGFVLNASAVTMYGPLGQNPQPPADKTNDTGNPAFRRGLRRVHWIAGVFHLLSSFLLAGFAGSKTWQSKITVIISSWTPFNHSSIGLTTLTSTTSTVTTSPLTTMSTTPASPIVDLTCSDSACFVDQRLAQITGVGLPVLDLVIIAALISSSYHAAVCGSQQEQTRIFKREQSKARWNDYSLSASAILVAVANLSGITEIWQLLSLAVLQWILLDVAGRLEVRFQNKDEGTVWEFVNLCVAYVLMWVPVLYAFCSGWIYDPKPPDAIIIIIVVLFSLYAFFIVVFVTARYGTGLSSRNIEIYYIALSFVSKTSLHWLLYVGIEGREGRVGNTREEAQANYNSNRNSSDADPMTLGLIAGGVFIFGIGFAVCSQRFFWKVTSSKDVKETAEQKMFLLADN